MQDTPQCETCTLHSNRQTHAGGCAHLYKWPLLPSRMWDLQALLSQLYAFIEDDIQVQWPGSPSLSMQIPTQLGLHSHITGYAVVT